MPLFAAVDLNWLLRLIITVLLLGGVLFQYVKVTASKLFLADEGDNVGVSDWSSSESSSTAGSSISTMTAVKDRNLMASMAGERQADGACAVCGDRTTKHCSGCKKVSYCSEACQKSHWKSQHKAKCKYLKSSGKSLLSVKNVSDSASGGSTNIIRRSKKILFPYEEFMDLFNWDKPGFPPCGLLNCGNSCFANVVLQCLAYTKPLVAFLLEKGHRGECRRNDWCFLCEFQAHVERASQSSHPFSPINILSRLPNIGGNLGYGKQEDAHEFMRFAIDTMQSVCLDIFGGEKALHPSSQETTLIQHIFGGHLQSQVICTKCSNVSTQFENMMDLTVEIHGGASSLEECLDQFTAKECLHGDNMYKCDRCNDYVMAWKRLTIRRAPNILTIALKRFQSGRFGKLNKRVAFPETLDLSPYMSEGGDDNNIYKLYAVIVHVDMLNASFFGHYICYIKDFRGNWYRIDDCKVYSVDLDEVLSQGAYMLLYSRICARSFSLYPAAEILKEKSELTNLEAEIKVLPLSGTPVQCNVNEESIKAAEILKEKSELTNVEAEIEVLPLSGTPVQCDVNEESIKESSHTVESGSLLPSEEISEFKDISGEEKLSSSINNSENMKMDFDVEDLQQESGDLMDIDICEEKGSLAAEKASPSVHDHNMILGDNLSANDSNVVKFMLPSSTSRVEDGDRGQTKGATKYSFIGSYDAVTMAVDNHVDGEESLPVSVSSTALRSSLVFIEPESTINKEKTINTSRGDPQPCVIPGAAGILDGEQSGASPKPNSSPGFLDNHLQKESTLQDGEVQTRVLGGNLSARGSSNDAVNGNGKITLPCSTSLVEDDTGGARECSISDSHDGVPMATSNHVDAQENVPVCVPSIASRSDVVFNELECTKGRDKELNTSSGHSQPITVPDAAGMPCGRRSGARSESLLSRGFLDKRQPKKSMKQVGEVHTILLGDDSSTRLDSDYSDVTQSTLPCSTSVVENRNGGHLIGGETESVSDSYNAVPVASNSHVNSEGAAVSEFYTASTSSLAFNEPRSTDNKQTIANASSRDPQPSSSSDTAALLDRRHSGASSKMLPRGFLDKSRPRKSMKHEAEVDTILVGKNSTTKIIFNDSDTSSGVATEFPIGDSYQGVPAGTDNDVDMEESVPVGAPPTASSSGVDFDESESPNTKEKRIKTPNVDSQAIVVPDAAGRSTAIRSRTRSGPFLFPGFLDKSRAKKSNKQEGEAIGLGKRVSSSSKLKSPIDGVAKFDSFGQIDGSVRSWDRAENGHCSHNNNDLEF